MSNTPSSPAGFRLSRGAALFIVVILALGALILAASSSSGISGARGNVTYVAWSSSDNAIYLEHPADWDFPTPVPAPTVEGTLAATSAAATEASTEATQAPGSTDYPVTISNDPTTQVDISLLPVSGLDAINTALVSAGKFQNDAAMHSQPIVVGSTRGVEIHQTRQPASTSVQDTDAWVVPLDASHVVVAWIQTNNWRNVEPLWMHMMATLRVDRNAGLRTLGILTATPTPTFTPTVTPAGTGAATIAATGAATPAATASAPASAVTAAATAK